MFFDYIALKFGILTTLHMKIDLCHDLHDAERFDQFFIIHSPFIFLFSFNIKLKNSDLPYSTYQLPS